ncbi:MAG: ABC transporter substrate-binding protein [Anaerolineae bacterium]|nr:ABC transporter substrate-binding protein [Anaerolineae bacterium]
MARLTPVTTRFARVGGTITGIRVVDPASDPAHVLAALVSEDPEAVYFADSQAKRAGTMSSLLHGVGISAVAWDSMEADVTLYPAGAGPAAEGDFVGIWGRSTAGMPGYVEFDALYQAAEFAHFGDEADSWGALAYDAADIVVAALDRADSLDSEAIRDAIAATANYQGVVGFHEGFDQKGDVVPQWVSLKHYYDGAWHPVRPGLVYLPLALTAGS